MTTDAIKNSVHCLLLAAGRSRRFGSPKTLHTMPNGKPMIVNTLALYQGLGIGITVVIHAGDSDLASVLKPYNVDILENENAAQGLSQSIVKGVGQRPDNLAWLVALADMPYVSPNTLNSIIKLAAPERIVLPRSIKNGVWRAGNPVCIGRTFKNQLLHLSGDVGAKNLIKQNPRSVDYVDIDDPGIHQDIDRLGDIVR